MTDPDDGQGTMLATLNYTSTYPTTGFMAGNEPRPRELMMNRKARRAAAAQIKKSRPKAAQV